MQNIGNLIKNKARQFSEAFRDMAPKTEGGKFFMISNDFALYMMREIKQVYGRSMVNAIPRILMVLAKHSDEKGVCWPSQKTIMELGAITNKNTLIKALKVMEELMIVVRRPGRGRMPNIYQLIGNNHWKSPLRLKYQNENKGIRNDNSIVANADTRIIPINKILEQKDD